MFGEMSSTNDGWWNVARQKVMANFGSCKTVKMRAMFSSGGMFLRFQVKAKAQASSYINQIKSIRWC